MKRRCGWMPEALKTPERIVWARNDSATSICPVSFVTAQSMAWIEDYLVRRKLGGRGIDGLDAREVEAFLILEDEITKESARQSTIGQHRPRQLSKNVR